jgi:hypothetical protein
MREGHSHCVLRRLDPEKEQLRMSDLIAGYDSLVRWGSESIAGSALQPLDTWGT